MSTLAPRYFLRAYYVNSAQAEFAFSRDFSTGPVVNPTKDKIEALLPPEGNIQTVRPETGDSSIGRMVLRLVDLGGEITRYISAAELTLATALSVGGGETEVVFNQTPDGLPAKGTLEIENERIRYTARDDALKKVTGITRAVDGTSLAAHSTGTLVRNGEQLRPGNRVQVFEGSETTEETGYVSYTVMDIVSRTRPGPEPVFVLEAQDVQRFTRKTIFVTATPSVPVGRSGNPILVLSQVYQTDIGIPAARLDIAGLSALSSDADFSGQTYSFTIKDPQDAQEWVRLLHRATGIWPFVKRDGKLSAKKIRLPSGGPFPPLTEANIVGVPQWFATDDRIINQISIRYDWDLAALPGAFQTVDTFEDVESRTRFGIQTSLVIESKGINTAQAGGTIAQKVAKRIFDRYRFPSEGFVARVFFAALRDFDIGDFVDFTHSQVINLKTGKKGITNAVCEVLDIRPVFGIGGPDQPPHLIVTLINTGVLTSAVNPSPTSVILTIAPPANVTGFAASQNGAMINFKWTQVTSAGLAGYEIRYGPRLSGLTYATAQPLTRVTRGTAITNAHVPPGDWRFFIKAINTGGGESVTAAQVDLVVTNTFDVIDQVPQEPNWLGTKTGFIRHQVLVDQAGTLKGVLIPDSQDASIDLDNFDWIDLFVVNPVPTCSYESPEMDVGFDDIIRAWALWSAVLGPGVASGIADLLVEIDYRKAADAYGGFRPWSIGNVEARFLKFKITETTVNGLARVDSMIPTADLAERTEKKVGVTVAAGGTQITFDKAYHRKPTVQVTGEGDVARIGQAENIATTGFKAHAFNVSGSSVGGTVTWEAVGV